MASCGPLTGQSRPSKPKAQFPANVWSINKKDVIAGYCEDGRSARHGFVRKPDGKFMRFDVSGPTYINAYGINEQGAVTGSYDDSTGLAQGFVRVRE